MNSYKPVTTGYSTWVYLSLRRDAVLERVSVKSQTKRIMIKDTRKKEKNLKSAFNGVLIKLFTHGIILTLSCCIQR